MKIELEMKKPQKTWFYMKYMAKYSSVAAEP